MLGKQVLFGGAEYDQIYGRVVMCSGIENASTIDLQVHNSFLANTMLLQRKYRTPSDLE